MLVSNYGIYTTTPPDHIKKEISHSSPFPERARSALPRKLIDVDVTLNEEKEMIFNKWK